jgi:predicted LPLAT superfamily acyltransferase
MVGTNPIDDPLLRMPARCAVNGPVFLKRIILISMKVPVNLIFQLKTVPSPTVFFEYFAH